ncbi:MAG: carbohydrate-binding family 9-like protein [Myxococcota bacterium]|nr:carbohydrate-binding family 9-like protein [Myxococcota bacterium]
MSEGSRAATVLCVAGLMLSSACTCEPPPRTEIPRASVPRASAPPTIDGRLDDDAWASAATTDRFVDTLSGAHAPPEVRARLTYDDNALYVAFEVADELLRSDFEGHDAHLWEQDAVELMIDPDGDGRSYVELQVSPTNLVFDTWFDTRRAPQPFGHVGWSSGLRSAVDARGGTANDDEADRGYVAEIAIPWSAFASIGTPAARPAPGDEWRVALYVLDADTGGQRGVGWSPPLIGDFHVPDRFGRLVFE